jgi:AcrR family transcriptional regulator
MSLEERKRATQNRIFAEAMALFAQKGFAATGVSEIAEKAGIGKGTFFNYFPTKQAIFGHIGINNLEIVSTVVSEGLAGNKPAQEIFAEQLRRVGAWADKNHALMKEAMAAGALLGHTPAKANPTRQRMRELLASVIEHGKARKEFKETVDSRVAALILEGAYFSLVADWLVGKPRGKLGSLLARGFGIVLQGLQK